MSTEPLTLLSKSALGAAFVRAVETERPDRLFDDPCAQAFLDAAPDALSGEDRPDRDPELVDAMFNVFSFHAVVRTKCFDDFLQDALSNGCAQIVLLAAGLDTRAYRLGWSKETRLFEVDLPEVMNLKNEVTAAVAGPPRCERISVPVDLAGNWRGALEAHGFSATVPTAWLAEGLLVYLSPEQIADLILTIDELSAPTSRLACDLGTGADGQLSKQLAGDPEMGDIAALWHSDGSAGSDGSDGSTGIIEMFDDAGWSVEQIDLATQGLSYGRTAPPHSSGSIVTAQKKRFG